MSTFITPAITCGRYDGRTEWVGGMILFDQYDQMLSSPSPFEVFIPQFPEDVWFSTLTADGTQLDIKKDDDTIHIDFYRGGTKTNYMKIDLGWNQEEDGNYYGYISNGFVSDDLKLFTEQGDSDSATYWCYHV